MLGDSERFWWRDLHFDCEKVAGNLAILMLNRYRIMIYLAQNVRHFPTTMHFLPLSSSVPPFPVVTCAILFDFWQLPATVAIGADFTLCDSTWCTSTCSSTRILPWTRVDLYIFDDNHCRIYRA